MLTPVMSYRLLLVEDDAGDRRLRGPRAARGRLHRRARRRRRRPRGTNCARPAWDAVILDWWLPGLDGLRCWPACGRRRTRRRCCSSPPATRSTTASRGLDGGADDYLVQAVRVRASCWPASAPCCAGSGRRPTARPALRRRARRPGDAAGRAGRQAARADGQGAGPARSSSSATPARCCRGRGSTSASGTSGTTGCRTRWRSTSWSCAASWRRTARG